MVTPQENPDLTYSRGHALSTGEFTTWNPVRSLHAFSKTDLDTDPIFLGMEWEVTHEGSNYRNMIKKAASLPIFDKINFGNGGAPIEMRTCPGTYRYLSKVISEEFFGNNLQQDMYITTSNGIHVHIDKKTGFPSTTSLNKFCVFINLPTHKSFIQEISGRAMTNWCAPNVMDVKYFVDLSKLPKKAVAIESLNRLTRIVGGVNKNVEGSGKHVAVNISGHASTVELRIFASQAQEAAVLKNLEFVDAVIRFTRTRMYNKLTIENFVKYVEEHQNDYPNLYAHSAIVSRIKTQKIA